MLFPQEFPSPHILQLENFCHHRDTFPATTKVSCPSLALAKISWCGNPTRGGSFTDAKDCILFTSAAPEPIQCVLSAKRTHRIRV